MNESGQGTPRPGKPTELVLSAERHGAVITPDMLPASDGANINGPSAVKVPDWMPGRLGAYYLYFAHHNGTYIRLAWSDSVEGPWQVHNGGVLSLDQCPFLKEHIASPDVHVDEQNRRFVMYFHGPTKVGKGQTTFAATLANGLHFTPLLEPLGPSYVRVFRYDGWWYGLFGTGTIFVSRSADGLSGFEKGPVVLPPSRGKVSPRHVAVQKAGRLLRVYYTRRGDAPERIFHGTIDLSRDWRQWEMRGRTELLRPLTEFEGADLLVSASRTGAAKGRENALRDPAIFKDGGRTWLFYAVAGESGIALAEILFARVRIRGLRGRLLTLQAYAGRLAAGLRPAVSRSQRQAQGGSGAGAASATRIFIAGCARSGTTLARNLMACFDDTYVHAPEATVQSLLSLDRGKGKLVVKRTAECHRELQDLPAGVGLVYCVRHPFDVLTSSHPETKHLRRFHVTTARWEAEYDGLIRLREAQPERCIFYLRYEDLIERPDAEQDSIAGAFGLSAATLFSEDPNNPIRATSLRKWESNEEFRLYLEGLPPAFLARVERFCAEFGYDMTIKARR